MLKNSMYKLLLALLVTSPVFSYEESEVRKDNEVKVSFDEDRFDGSDCCQSTLKIVDLCTKNIRTRCLDSHKMNTNSLDVKHKACVHEAAIQRAHIQDASIHRACIHDGSVQNLCANSMNVSDLTWCNKFRATVTLSSVLTYTLGTPVPFDAIIDDPNNNILPTGGYTVPRSGYYMATLQLIASNLRPFNPAQILGTPIANLHIYVNGAPFREIYSPFLAFFNTQNSLLSALLSLKAGDVVTSVLEVISIDQTLGVQNVIGTVDLLGNGTEVDSSIAKIIYLSSDCLTSSCQPCEVHVPCEPHHHNPCHDHCSPCHHDRDAELSLK